MTARVTRALAGAAVLLGTGFVGAAPAGAHVHASSPGAVRGGVAMVTFEVPNESPTGSATTELTVTLPDVASARTETKPGWTARMDRDAATGTVRSVTWTATPGAGVGADQFGLFRIAVKLPDADTVTFPAAQRYADGTVVRWDQDPLPGGGEPDRPVPALHLVSGPAAPMEHHAQHPAPAVSAGPAETEAAEPEAPPHDNAARLLGGTALLVAALAVTVAITRRRT
ncbi:YcnI family protein [Mycobacterium sp. M1]|uniref:YcnI family protein n=1 Tax=Mycolicibacter acidiphilus TaxID=2835306 RepID=A0ABS5RNZ9_9MYCO|nr:YcnI family protein [Mycolicibacter acidiphilus]MBS9535221.1 YcnI family protein [Mycolicibacter acidiphilus]